MAISWLKRGCASDQQLGPRIWMSRPCRARLQSDGNTFLLMVPRSEGEFRFLQALATVDASFMLVPSSNRMSCPNPLSVQTPTIFWLLVPPLYWSTFVHPHIIGNAIFDICTRALEPTKWISATPDPFINPYQHKTWMRNNMLHEGLCYKPWSPSGKIGVGAEDVGFAF